MCRGLRLSALALVALVATLSAGALPASGAPLGEVRSFPTPGVPIPGIVTAGSEGDMWITDGTTVGRLTTGGEITTFSTSKAPVGDMVAGSDGNIWFGEVDSSSTVVGRLTPLGELTEFNELATFKAHRLTLGPEGDVWYTAGLPGFIGSGKEGGPSAIGRITPSGLVTEFRVGLASKAILEQIVAGPDGNLWFVNQAEPGFAIGRITPTGEIKEFPIAGKPWLKPSGIAAGVNGNVYFGASGENPITTEEESLIEEMTPAGETKQAARLNNSDALELATGPEGSIWFTAPHAEPLEPNVIGRLTPAGVLEEDVASFGTETEADPITPGPDGSMWFVTVNKTGREVHSIGTGAPAASQTPPTVVGPDQIGGTVSCDGAAWSTWAGQQPSTSLHGFDGYTWLLDGRAIAGQSGQSLTLGDDDLGHRISCTVTATYQLLNVTVSATSPTVPIGPASLPSAPASTLTLPHQTDRVTSNGALHVTLDCSGAPCSGTVKLTHETKLTAGKGRHKHTKTVLITIASATFSSLPVGTDEVALKLNSVGAGLRASPSRGLPVDASVSYVSSGSTHVSTTGTITLVGPKPKHKPKPKRRTA